MKNKEYIDRYFNEMIGLIEKLPKEKIDNIIEILYDAWKNEKTIFIMGNGGSASTATHFAADLSKATIIPGKKRFKSISLTDNIPLLSAWVNDEGFENLFVGQLENLLEEGDVVIAISVHGGTKKWSNNLVKALRFAKEKSATTIGFAGFDGGMMKEITDECLIVPIDSTPQVESLHVVLHHLITFGLKEKIKNE